MYNILIGQSGGPTAVINASLSGVVSRALEKKDEIDKVYGMVHGIEGFLDGNYIDFEAELEDDDLEKLKVTPAAYLGSCRFKLSNNFEDEVYQVLFAKFAVLNIGAVFYIGGNDSMDTVDKLSRYGEKIGSSIRFIGIPKTIDNDLMYTDHTPGFGSAAKYVAATVKDIIWDCGVYKHPSVTIVEIMGRHAGWLTAAAMLARTEEEKNPMLIYLPEHAFNVTEFVESVKEAITKTNYVVVCVSEGIADKEGKFICEYGVQAGVDKFGHKMLTGCGKILENIVKNEIGCKCRSIELNLPQRCSAYMTSNTDVMEAFNAGSYGVDAALKGETAKMVGFKRYGEGYNIEYVLVDAGSVCNQEKKFPDEWIVNEGRDIAPKFLQYVLPLVKGENTTRFSEGVPEYVKPIYLKKKQYN